MGRLTHRTSPGSTYFVTTKTWQNVPVFQGREVADIAIDKLLEYRRKGNYLLHEFVVMPNHLHLILTPTNSISLEKAIQLIKGGTSYEIHKVRAKKMQIWQSGFHESRIRDAIDYRNKSDYIRFNPVVAKLVERPQDWSFGSASGKYPLDPIPQGLKPPISYPLNVGPKGPTPQVLEPKASGLVTHKGPTPQIVEPEASELVTHKGPSPQIVEPEASGLVTHKDPTPQIVEPEASEVVTQKCPT